MTTFGSEVERMLRGRIGAYAVALLAAGCGLVVTVWSVVPLAGPFFMFQFAAVVGAALHGGMGPGLVTMLVSGVGSYLLYFAPHLEPHEVNRLISFALVSLLFVWIATKVRAAKAAAEEARARAERAEAEARRVGSWQERLVAIVSHDLRSPLNAIALTGEVLERAGDLTDRQSTGVLRMLASARRMRSMIGDLLDFALARNPAGLPVHPQEVRVGEVCVSALEEVRAAHPARTIEVAVAGDDVAAIDADRLEQVVSNLVTNALVHGDAAAPVTVGVTGGPDGVRLEVTNRGRAIPAPVAQRLFEPFHAGGANGSVGLGLFIVSEIARAHGGAVGVRSDDSGTTFTVEFPRSHPVRPPAAT